MAEQPSTPAIDPKELERLKSIFGSSPVQKSNFINRPRLPNYADFVKWLNYNKGVMTYPLATTPRRIQYGTVVNWKSPYYDELPMRGTAPSGRQFTYWEYPQRVARFANMIRSAPPDWQAPDWMDKQSILDAYDYMKAKNGTGDWSQWKALDDNDPGVEFLQSLAPPPIEFVLPTEQSQAQQVLTDQQVAQQQPVDYETLPQWMKTYLGIFVPQAEGITGRTNVNRFSASALQSLMVGFGVGAGVGAFAGPIPGVIAGLGAAGLLTYQNYTGNQIPLLNEIMIPFNILAEAAESTIGNAMLASVEGLPEVMDDIPSAYRSGLTAYETWKATNVPNWFALWARDVSGNYTGPVAGKNEIWKISQGMLTPQKAPYGKGGEAIAHYHEWIESGDAMREFMQLKNAGQVRGRFQDYVTQKAYEDYGDTAIANDIVMQTTLDPLNFAPWALGRSGQAITGKIAKSATDVNTIRIATQMNEAFKMGTGNPFIDALPIGVQQIVKGITHTQDSAGLLGTYKIYQGLVRGNYLSSMVKTAPADIITKVDELVKSGVKADEIHFLDDTITWKDAQGVEQVYKSAEHSRIEVPEIDDLTDFEKLVGGIDEEYGLKELRPTLGDNWFSKLKKLTPAAQVTAIMNTFHGNIASLFDAAQGDPAVMVKIFKQMAGQEPIAKGDLGETILKSAESRAVTSALKYALEDGDLLDNFYSEWVVGAQKRAMLEKIAMALDEAPADVLQQMKDKPDVMAQRMNNIAPELKTTPDFLTETLKVFVGDDALPWNTEQFQAQMIIKVADKMDGYFKDVYGLKPESYIFRLSNVFKGVQSLVLLGLNPAYLMNNWVNNVVTRAAEGVGGYMTAKQINEFYERMGVFPKDTGLSGYDDITGRVVHSAMEVEDALGKIQKALSKVNHKVGVFTRLSGWSEKMEGNQARVSGARQFLAKEKKVGAGIRPLDPVSEKILDQRYPGLKEGLYGAIRAGMNMKEIEDSIRTTVVQPRIESILDEISSKHDNGAPGSARDLFDRMGLTDRLNDRLKTADTPDKVDAAFDAIEGDVENFIRKIRDEELKHIAEDTRNKAREERLPFVLQSFGDMVIENTQLWINSRKDWERLYALQANDAITKKQFHNIASSLNEKHIADWNNFNDRQLQTMKGIIEGLGIDNEYTRSFIQRTADTHALWKDFWQERKKLLKRYFSQGENGKLTWDEVETQLGEMYDATTKKVVAAQAELDGLFARSYKEFTGWDETAAVQWRAELFRMQHELFAEQSAMRERTKGMDQVERDLAYAVFNEKYNAAIAKMKQLEHDGAYSLMNKPAPAMNVEIPEVPNPVVDKMVTDTVKGDLLNRGYTPEQVNELLPDQPEQPLQPVRQPNPIIQKAADVVKAKITAEDIIAQADATLREKMIRDTGRAARSDVEEGFRQHFKGADETKITVTMALFDDIILRWAKRNGITGDKQAIIDAYYGTRLRGVLGAEGELPKNALEKLDQLMEAERMTGLMLNPNFTNWFGDSKVVDADGNPLVMYHGTGSAGFEEFDLADPYSMYGLGYYFTENTDIASGYAKRRLNFTNSKLEPFTFDSIEILDANKSKLFIDRIKERDAGSNEYHWFINDLEKYATTENGELIASKVLQNTLDYESYWKVFQETADELGIKLTPKMNGEAVLPVYLSIKKPFDAEGWYEAEEVRRIYESANKLTGAKIPSYYSAQYGKRLFQDLIGSIPLKNIDGPNKPLGFWTTQILRDAGYDGITHIGGGNTNSVAHRVYIAFDNTQIKSIFNQGTWDPNNPNILKQGESPKGSYELFDDATAVIRGFEQADVSSMVHEMGHVFLKDLPDADIDTVARLAGMAGVDEFKDLLIRFANKELEVGTPDYEKFKLAEESFARNFERYLAEGDAPTPELRSLFRQFSDWLLNIYQALQRTMGRVTGFEKTKLAQDVIDIRTQVGGRSLRDIFDGMLTDKVDRPPTFDQLVSDRFSDVKQRGRNAVRFKDQPAELTKMAQRELIGEMFKDFASQDEARAYVEGMTDYHILPDGTQLDDVALYDGLRFIDDNPDMNPWNKTVHKEVRSPKKTIAYGVSNHEIEYPLQFKVVELEHLIPSDVIRGDNLIPNPDYTIPELQNRITTGNTGEISNRMSWIYDTANKFNPDEVLYDTRNAQIGTPIVSGDNLVASGNGRVAVMQFLFENSPEKWAEYQQKLIKYAAEVGIPPESYADMVNPVLVRELDPSIDVVEFAKETNKPPVAVMTATELALNDAGNITPEMLRKLNVLENEDIYSSLQQTRNAGFINEFMKTLTGNEKAGMTTNNLLNQAGMERIVNALISKVYNTADGEMMLDTFRNSTDNNIKTLQQAIMASLPQMAYVEGLIQYGMRDASLSISDDIAFAANKVSSLRDQGMSAGEYLGQMGLFGEGDAANLTPSQVMLLNLFDSRAPKKIREALRKYANKVDLQPAPGQETVANLVRTKEEILNDAIFGTDQPAQQGDIFGQRPDAGVAETIQGNELARPETAGEILPAPAGDEGIPGVVEPIQGTEQSPSVIAKAVIDSETKADYDAGKPVPIERASEIDLTHQDTLPIPDDVSEIINSTDTFKFDKKQQAKDYVEWVMNGEKGARPDVSQEVIDSYAGQIDRLREHSAQKARGVTAEEVAQPITPSETVAVTKLTKERIDGKWTKYQDESGKFYYELGKHNQHAGKNVVATVYSVNYADPSQGNKMVEIGTFETRDAAQEFINKHYNEQAKASPLAEEANTASAQAEVAQIATPIDRVEVIDGDKIQMLYDYGDGYTLGKQIETRKRNIYSLYKNGERLYYPVSDVEIFTRDNHKGAIQSVEEQKRKTAPAQPGITITKVFAFKHGEIECVANVYKDGELIAYAPAVPLKDARLDADTRILGLDPQFPDKWVYEQDGVIKTVDSRKPEVEQQLPVSTNYNRAPAGGIIGMNGEFYPGGTFLPNTTMPKLTPEQRKANKFLSTKQETAPYIWELPPADNSVSIFRLLSGALPYDKKTNQFSYDNVSPNTIEYLGGIARVKELVDAHNKGAKWIDRSILFKKPEIGGEQAQLFQSGQLDMFSQSAADLPLFSGTAMGADDVAFKPKEASPQMSMFPDIVPEAKPTRVIEIAIKEKGATSYIRLDIKKTKAIRDTIALHEGAEMTARILDAKGKVVESNLDPNDVVNPKMGGNALFQAAETATPEQLQMRARTIIGQLQQSLKEAGLELTNDQIVAIVASGYEKSNLLTPAQKSVFATNNAVNVDYNELWQTLFSRTPETSTPYSEMKPTKDRLPYSISEWNKATVTGENMGLNQNNVQAQYREWSSNTSAYRLRDLSEQPREFTGPREHELQYWEKGKYLRKNFDSYAEARDWAIEHAKKYNPAELHQDAETAPLPDNTAPIGRVPLNGTPTIEPYARMLDEVNSDYIRPLMDDIKQSYKEKLRNPGYKWGEIAKEHQKIVTDYLKGTVNNDLATVKNQAMKYGQMMRDNALLNYSRRYGADNYLQLVFPYQFWYTRTMMNWAKRMVDKPSWYAMYARMQASREKMEREGMPTRLRGKLRLNMPWMPEWMGGGIWVDPMSKIFPFHQFGQPFEQFSNNQVMIQRRAEAIINEMKENELVTPSEAENAIETMAGQVWENAVSQAELELDKSSNPTNLVTMMMQPALWWTIPSNIAKGTPEKMSPLPITRTGQTMKELGRDTFMEPITDAVGGLLAGPETAIRKKAGLSEFGQWGDYYVDRMLAGMAASGEISTDDARLAMVNRQGPAFQEALQRITTEQSLRTPGALGITALKEGAKPGQILAATLAGIFGGSLFSEGEMKMRGLKPIYDNAWNKLKAGDESALNDFYDQYPEYAARLALYDEPEERLHQFLVDSVWRNYMDLDTANKRLARETLGDEFMNSFLNKETRSYESIDDNTLAMWAKTLKPDTILPDATSEVEGMPIDYYPDEIAQEIDAYYDEKSRLFPNSAMWNSAYGSIPKGSPRQDYLNANPQLQQYWNEKSGMFPGITKIQDEYFAIPESSQERRDYLKAHPELSSYWAWKKEKYPEINQLQDEYYAITDWSQRKQFLADHPQIKKYWDWNDKYLSEHPNVAEYVEGLKSDHTDDKLSAELSTPLIRQLYIYATGGSLSAGAKSELDRIRKQIAPELSQEQFIQIALSLVMGDMGQ